MTVINDFFYEISKKKINFLLWILSWCKIELSWTTRSKQQIYTKSKKGVHYNSSLIFFLFFSKKLYFFLLFRFLLPRVLSDTSCKQEKYTGVCLLI